MKPTTHRPPLVLHVISGNSLSCKEISTCQWFTPLCRVLHLRLLKIMLLNLMRPCFLNSQTMSASNASANSPCRRYWPGSSHPSTRTTTSCINSGFSTSDCSRKCVHAPPATTPCLPRCTWTLSRPSTAMAYANSNVDFPSARRPQPPPRSFKCTLAHPN
ncbi:hypothetical protein BGY98DRAFT_616583 [Russula aff. rugulosa BPL654]|nr:hypothetical protein BGY98DRAFT_616583 [Russula aff. rugulosa BPL654]